MYEYEFIACKHLDFNPDYIGNRQAISFHGTKLCWKRPEDFGGNLVQFCKKIGRLNNPEACLDKEHAGCDLYEEFMHKLSIPKEEIDS